MLTLQQENERLKQWKNDEGKVYWTAQKSVQLNTERMNNIQQLLSQKENRKDIKNEQIEASHTEEVIVTASTLSWITVLMEILFECCISYIWYFYYHSFVERKIVGSLEIDHSPAPSISQLPPPESDVAATLQELQQQIQELQEQQQSGISDLRPPQKAQKNGVQGEINDIRRPIGFTKNQETPYNALQCVATNEKIFLREYHKDSRTGEIKHYTLARVENFITHYKKAVQIAIRTKMETSILDNRKKWLSYWKEKKMELLAKQDEVLS